MLPSRESPSPSFGRIVRFTTLLFVFSLFAQLAAPLLLATPTAHASPPLAAALYGAPPSAMIGQRYSYRFPQRGSPAPAVRVEQGMLPPGLSLASDGTLSGMPFLPGVYNFSIAAQNGVGQEARLGTTVTITDLPSAERRSAAQYQPIDPGAVQPAAPAARVQPRPLASGTNLALNKPATADSQCETFEGPEKAVDGDTAAKWCSWSETGSWLRIDLGATAMLDEFVITHAGATGELTTYNTRDFSIDVSSDGSSWTTVVNVTGNTSNITTHPITPVATRYVRLNVSKGTSYPAGGETWRYATRIPEFETYGAFAPVATATPTSIPTATPAAGGPYGGQPAAVPGTIEAEQFNTGGEGVAYHDLLGPVDLEAGNDGCVSEHLADFQATEWVKYTIAVAATGVYDMHARVSAPGSGGTFHVEIDGTDVTGAVAIPNTNGWLTFQTVKVPNIGLDAGTHVMRVVADQNLPGYTAIGNINWIGWTTAGAAMNYGGCSPTATVTASETATATATAIATATETATTTATEIGAATATPTATATATATPPPSLGYVDVGSVRVWGETLTGNAAQGGANGNVRLGSASQNTPLFTVGGASWTSADTIAVQGPLGFVGGVTIGQGTFSVNTASGLVTWDAGSASAMTKLGSSDLPIAAKLVVNVLQQQVQGGGTVTLSLPENSGASVQVYFTLAPNGAISSTTTSKLIIKLAGGTLGADVLPTNEGLTSAQPSLSIPTTSVIQLPALLLDGKGANKLRFGSNDTFALGDINLGGGALVLQNLTAKLSIASGAYQLSLTGNLGATKVPENAALSLPITGMKLAGGIISGAPADFKVSISGLELALKGATLQSASNAYQVTFTSAELSLPADFASTSVKPTIALTNVTLTTGSPYLSIDGGKGTFQTSKAFVLGGDTSTATLVKFDKISGSIALSSGSWKVSLVSDITFKFGKTGTDSVTASKTTLTIAAGKISGSIASLNLKVAGLDLSLTNLAYKDAQFSAASATLKMPAKWSGSTVSVSNVTIAKTGLQIGGAGATFPIPDVTLGSAGMVKLTAMKGAVKVDTDGAYAISISATVNVSKVQSTNGGSLTVAGTLSIKDGRVDGTVTSLAFKLSGVEFSATNLKFVDDKLTVQKATLKLPLKGSSASATVNGLELGGDAGFKIQGAKVILPDFKIGTVGVQGATVEFKKEGSEYTIAGAAKFEFTKFAVDGSFKIGYSSSNGVSLKSVSLAFTGSIPSPAIPLGSTGFYIVRLSGSFDMDDGSASLTLSLGASSALRVGSNYLVDVDGTVTLKIKPQFELSSSASMKVIGVQVASVDLRITSSSFSLKGEARLGILRASMELTFGKESNGDFTFYGSLRADVVIPRGYFCDSWWCPTLPRNDYKLASASLDGGKFRRGGDTIWGARGQAGLWGYDLYVWAKFGPGGSDYGIGKKLKDYEPVRPARALRASATSDTLIVSIPAPADYLMVIEAITTTNRIAPQELQLSGPAGVQFTKRMTYESPEHDIRLYRVDFAKPANARGTWSLVTQRGNVVMVQGAEPPPQIDSFTACVTGGSCLSPATPLTIEQGTPIGVAWSTSAYTPGLMLNLYAISDAGTRYPLAHQETASAKTLANTLSWKSALPSGAYTLSLVLESDGFAPVTVDKGRVTINDTTAPAAPANFAARAEADMSAVATWNGDAAEADVAGYQVSVDGGEPIAIDGRLSRYLSYGLAAGSDHTVAVAAYDLSGNVGPAAMATLRTPTIGVSAAWPLRDSETGSIGEVGASFSQPISESSFMLLDKNGSMVPGEVTPLTAEASVTETVTLGSMFRPASGELAPGVYTALITAKDPATRDAIAFTWSFTVLAVPRQVYLPLVIK